MLFTAGLGWRGGRWTLDLGYMLLLQEDRRGRVRGALPGEEPTTALNTGEYGFGAHLLGLTLVVGL